MERAEREAIMRQGVTLPETPLERRQREALDEDLAALRGRPLRLRLTNFLPLADAYLAAARGPLAYMLRLHEIERQTAAHEERLGEARQELARACEGDDGRFEREWRGLAASWSFDEVNDLIARHNTWYPTESRLPMDPKTGDFVLVAGRDYRMSPLDADWLLARFPPALEDVPADL
jgi:hypothetical protein